MALGTKTLAPSELDTFEDQRLVEELRKAKEHEQRWTTVETCLVSMCCLWTPLSPISSTCSAPTSK